MQNYMIKFIFELYTLSEITTHPQDKVLAVGLSVSLTCTSSVSSDVTFSWTSDGRDVTGQSTSTGDTSILTISDVQRNDSGSYTCTVRSESLSVISNIASLNVFGKLYIYAYTTYKYQNGHKDAAFYM